MKEFPIIYKRATTGAAQQWQIIVDGNQFFTRAGQWGGVITESARTTCEGKNIGRANETSPEEQALAEATSKHNKKLEKASGITEIGSGTFQYIFSESGPITVKIENVGNTPAFTEFKTLVYQNPNATTTSSALTFVYFKVKKQ